MWAAGVFHYWHAVLVNIINCLVHKYSIYKKKVQSGQIHTQDITYEGEENCIIAFTS